MLNTAVYLRVSTEEQAKEGYSIHAQEEKLRGYARAKDWHIYDIYAVREYLAKISRVGQT